MYQKTCPHCEEKSFSSARNSKWICPNCGVDITHVQAEVAKSENNTTRRRGGDFYAE